MEPAGRRGGKATIVAQWIDEHIRLFEARETVLRDVSARGLNPPKAEHSPVVVVRWTCLKPTEIRKTSESMLMDWIMEVQETPGPNSLIDRYRFPYL